MVDYGEYLICSLFMDNIPLEVREYQAKVFERLGVPLQQIKLERPTQHIQESMLIGSAMESVVEQNKDRVKYFIFFDIDCIPLNKEAIEFYDKEIKAGKLVGPAQRSNHIENGKHVFAAPCALGFSSNLYQAIKAPLGASLFKPNGRSDTAEEFTWKITNNEHLVILQPTNVEKLVWPLAGDELEYGEGTTYGIDGSQFVYHAFNSRHQATAQRFINKCREVLGYPVPQPMFTVVMPCSRIDKQNALDSVMNQDYEDGEIQLLIIHDGAPKFNDTPILKAGKYGNIRLDHMVLPYNTYTSIFSSTGGIPRCIGSAMAQGKYVCFLDDDCTWKLNHLSSLAAKILDTNAHALFTLRDFYSEEGKFLSHDDFESLNDPNAVSGRLIDTNCLCINRHTLWNTFSGWLCPQRAEDRWILQNILANGVEIVPTNLYTVNYKLPKYLENNSRFWLAQKEYLTKNKK